MKPYFVDFDGNTYTCVNVRIPDHFMAIMDRMFPLEVKGNNLKRGIWLGKAIQGSLLVADLLQHPPSENENRILGGPVAERLGTCPKEGIRKDER